MTQWAMNQIAQVGLLKMDFLGLTNLTILDTAVTPRQRAPRPNRRLPQPPPQRRQNL